ncbi:DUF4430 domain-containing protein [Sporolactobacillus sp. THM7-4]|nr:DUF4430 domain-containing protein [Sporolactobacillus sp. THM7-4]
MNKKRLISLLAVLVVLVVGFFAYRVTTFHPASSQQQALHTATLEIKGGTKEINAKVPVTKNETALEQLEKYTKAHHIQITVTGSGKMAYVKSLQGLKADSKKGWMFMVNGKMPKVGAGAVVVKANQKVVWTYSKY